MKEVQHWGIFGRMCIILIDKNGIVITIMKVNDDEFYLKTLIIIETLVCETSWTDVFDAGIGGQRTQNDREEPRVPSAYLLVYINADQKSLSNGRI